MPHPFLKLNLTYGQVVYALCHGQPLDPRTRDQLRYLRLLGVPYDLKKKGRGRGNQQRYGFEELIELGVGLFGLRQRMTPRDVAHYLTSQRTWLRRLYRQALEDIPETSFTADWVKSRGRIIPQFGNDILLRLHDRYRDQAGQIENLRLDELGHVNGTLGDTVERYAGEAPRVLVPLTRLVIELVAWAAEAPTIRPGRPG